MKYAIIIVGRSLQLLKTTFVGKLLEEKHDEGATVIAVCTLIHDTGTHM